MHLIDRQNLIVLIVTIGALTALPLAWQRFTRLHPPSGAAADDDALLSVDPGPHMSVNFSLAQPPVTLTARTTWRAWTIESPLSANATSATGSNSGNFHGFVMHRGLDSTPGAYDMKHLEGVYRNEARCAQACNDAYQADQSCHGFVVYRLSSLVAPVRCYFKSARFSPYANKQVVSYFRPVVYRKSTNLSIVFGVLTAAKHLHTRLLTAYKTWLNDVESLVFLEDDRHSRHQFALLRQRLGISNAPAPLDVLSATKPLSQVRTAAVFLRTPIDVKLRSINGAWKNLPIVNALLQRFPDRQWYAIVDDDSFIIKHNLNILLTTYYHQASKETKPLYIGVAFLGGKVVFAQGGAGILLNGRAMSVLNAHLPQCMRSCVQWAGDIRLGCCASIAGIKISPENAFWSQPVFSSLVRDNRPARSTFPVSFHVMRNTTWVKDTFIASTIVGESDDLCVQRDYLFANTTTCQLRQEYALLRHSGRLTGGVDPILNGTQVAVPVSWDVLMRQFRNVWGTRYADIEYTMPTTG